MAATSSAAAPHYNVPSSTQPEYVDCNDLRTVFAYAMSEMYKTEVPLYGDLVRIVQQVNDNVVQASSDPSLHDPAQRLTLERHGAIRLGTPKELQTVRRLFGLLGMRAVGYYDLSVAGLPMHATCFRPTDAGSLSRNPFRVFTTLLRPELLRSDNARDLAKTLLDRRQIFTPELLRLLDVAEKQDGRLTHQQAEAFVPQALRTFSWQPVAAATRAEYVRLRKEHAILADIACFQNAHINHLTPRTLNITTAQQAMKEAGMAVKESIEGPPRRTWPILLRQTSFLALEESVQFRLSEDESKIESLVDGSHRARFGEIEERGAAVKPAGRKLYDELLGEANARASQGADSQAEKDSIMMETFARFPDDWTEMRKQSLVYCKYECSDKCDTAKLAPGDARELTPVVFEKLLAEGAIHARPITYEDFLPFSAAGIFQSNLQANKTGNEASGGESQADQPGFERSLESSVISADELYAATEADSLRRCAVELGFK